MRSSLYIEGPEGESLVIDTGPEFRLQAIRAEIKKLDALFLTHSHADHIHGLDDVRPLCHNKPLPVYGNSPTIIEMKERFSYVFDPETQQGGGKPRLVPTITDEPVKLGSLCISPIPVMHGSLDILSWYITEASAGFSGGLLYMTDTSSIAKTRLPQPEILIIGGLRARPHSTHFNFDQALTIALELGCRQVLMTHICHEHFHREIEKYCRDFAQTRGISHLTMSPAWDGQELRI
jgi:phosphoribosyl 1,2-cyclic phosphate phosphodiesterase